MRLLVVTTSVDRSEAAVWIGLAALPGWQVDVMCDPHAAHRQALVDAGLDTANLTIRHRLDLRAVRAVRRRLDNTRYDVFYAPSNKSLSVSLLAAGRRPIKRIAYRGTIGHLSRWDPASRLTYFHPRVDRIVCVSNAVRHYLLGLRLPPERLITIYKGHDIAWYDALPPIERRDVGIPDDAVIVGFTGTIRPVKGVHVLVRAFDRMAVDPALHLLLVGKILDQSLERLIARSPHRERIHTTGFRTDAAALAGLCDVFVMPTLEREGLPRSVIEAMAQRVPPVVTRVGGMPELVEDGVSGRVIQPNDVSALENALRELLADPDRRLAMGRQARARIESDFHIERTIAQYRALIEPAFA